MMIDPDRIERHLKTLLAGEVRFDDVTRTIYSMAACIYKIVPLGVVFPKHKNDLIKLLEYAYDQEIPVTARGAGSGLAGQTVNEGLIVDLSKYMNEIVRIDPESGYAVVQPGVVQDQLQERLKRHGKFFPPDPSSSAYSTLGGGIANNSSGARSVKYGSTKDYVISLEMVLSNGELVETSPMPLDDIPERFPRYSEFLEGNIYTNLRELYLSNKDAIEGYERRTKSSSGYNIFDLVQNGVMDLSKLIVGSEGTLAIVTEAKLRVIDLPKYRRVAMAYFDDIVKSGEAVPLLLELDPSAIDLMDGMVLDLVRGREKELKRFVPEGAQMAYLIEFDGADADDVEERLSRAGEILRENALAFEYLIAQDKTEEEQLWRVRKVASAILNRVSGDKRPVRFIEDVTVPPDRLAEFLHRLWGILKRNNLRVGTIGHAGDSSFHVRPLLDLRKSEDIELMCRLSDEVYSIVTEMGGSISGEHGDGLLRTPFLRKQFGEISELFPKIKGIFDPNNILNPGKIVPQEGKGFTDNLRLGAGFSYLKTGSRLDDQEMLLQLDKCDGCGACRSFCPMFQGIGEEKGASRGKVALIKGILSGDLPLESLKSREIKEIIDLCYNCKRCVSECPSLTNVAALCVEARRIYTDEHGLSVQNRFLGNASKIAPLGSAFAPIANLSMRLGLVRCILQSFAGIHKDRSMPKYRFKTLSRMHRNEKPKTGRKVAYFPGCYANYNDPAGEGISTIRLLESQGFDVFIPKTKCCNVARITMGDIDGAMGDIQHNIDVLLGLVDEGFEIVFSAPSCLLAVRSEYPEVIGDERSKRLAQHCHYIFEFLADLSDRGELDLNYSPVHMDGVYQIPCHQRALGTDRTPELLAKIPELNIARIVDRCCGIAGTFGMKKQNFDLSMKVGQPLFDEILSVGADLVLSSCGTCRLQIEQATGLPTIHPIEVLYRSTGGRE